MSAKPSDRGTSRAGASDAAHDAEWYRLIAENASDGVFRIGPSGEIEWASEAAAELVGCTPDELVGRPIAALVAPEDLPVMLAAAARVRSEGRATYRARLLLEGGSARWAELTVRAVFDADGNVVARIGSGRDVQAEVEAEEARHMTEERYRLLADNASDVVWTTGPDGRSTYVSPSVERIRGYTAAEAMAQSRDEVLAPDSVARSTAYFTGMLEAIAGGRRPAAFRGELEYRCKDGSTAWCDVMAYPILDKDGSLIELLGVSRDLTEHKRHEAELHLGREIAEAAGRALETAVAELSEAQRIAHVGSWTWDAVTGDTEWSDETFRIFGMEPGRTAPRLEDQDPFFTLDSRERLDAAIAEATATGGEYEVRLEIVRASGEHRHVVVHGETVADAAGSVVRLRGTIADVTDATAAQEALRASEARHSELVQRIPLGVYMIRNRADGAFAFEYLSPRAEQLFGVSSAAAVADPVVGLSTIHPDDLPGLWAASEEARALAAHFQWEGRFIFEGETRLVRLSGDPTPLPDGWTRWYGVVEDVTRRRREQAALRRNEQALAEAQRIAHVGSWTWNPQTDVAEWSDEMFRIFGRERGAAAPSLDEFTRWITPESGERLRAAMGLVMVDGAANEFQIEVVRPSGEHRFCVARDEGVRDEAGRVVLLRGTIADVTDGLRLTARLAESQRLEAIGRLAGGVAHDFNNALMAINGTAELMLDLIPPGDPLRDDVESIRVSGKRAAALARQLQAFGRSQTLSPRPVNLGEALRATAPLFRRAVGDAIEIRVDAGRGVPAALVDKSQLDEVLLALVFNARDDMPDGGSITFATAAVDVTPGQAAEHPRVEPGAFVRLDVTDTGPRTEPETLAHIFEPFYSTAQLGRGSGLGLATVHGIVAQSEGWIEASSTGERGTTFSIFLPVAPARVEQEAAPRETVDSGFRASDVVLLVEDEPAVRTGVARMLRGLGMTVIEKNDGREGLAIDDEELGSLSIVVSDVVMPGVLGSEMAHALRERRPGLPVLFVSGYSPDDELRSHLDEDGVLFLAKPFARDELVDAVRKLLAWSPLERRADLGTQN
jgi:two-component system, cell cycle sensor histidine kinase and response regulator CckA